MDRKIAEALVRDMITKKENAGSLDIKHDGNVYTVSVTSSKIVRGSQMEIRAYNISALPSGSPCSKCNGTGRA